MNNLGQSFVAAGKLEQAEKLFAELYQRAPTAEIDPDRKAVVIARWGPVLVDLKRYGEAEAPLLEAYQRLSKAESVKPLVLPGVLRSLVKLYDATGKPEEAAKYRRELEQFQPTSRPAATDEHG
jgi:tetratricopeptide (TPR) repeat protein